MHAAGPSTMNIDDNSWSDLLDTLIKRAQKVKQDEEFKRVYNKFGLEMNYFVKSVEQLKKDKEFTEILDIFPKNKENIWIFLEKIAKKEVDNKKCKHFEEAKGFFGMKTGHLFLFAYELGGGLLILGIFYKLDSSYVLSTGANLSIFQILMSVCGFGATVAIEGLSQDDWKLYFGALGTFFGMIELKAVTTWLNEETQKNSFLEQSGKVLVAVMFECLIEFLDENKRELKLSETVNKTVKRYLCDGNEWDVVDKFFASEDEIIAHNQLMQLEDVPAQGFFSCKKSKTNNKK